MFGSLKLLLSFQLNQLNFQFSYVFFFCSFIILLKWDGCRQFKFQTWLIVISSDSNELLGPINWILKIYTYLLTDRFMMMCFSLLLHFLDDLLLLYFGYCKFCLFNWYFFTLCLCFVFEWIVKFIHAHDFSYPKNLELEQKSLNTEQIVIFGLSNKQNIVGDYCF